MKFWIMNIGLAAVLAAGAVKGWTQIPFLSDVTYITWAIAAGFLYSLWLLFRKRMEEALTVAEELLFLGLIGTVVGIIIALGGLEAGSGNASDIKAIMVSLVSGLSAAFYTTMIGSVCSMWVRICARIV